MLCEDLLIIDRGKSVLQGNLKQIIDTYVINGSTNHSLNEIFIDKVGSLDE